MTNLNYGETHTLTANAFTKDHYYFIGWAPSPGSSVIYSDQDSVSNLTTTQGATITLYAT